MKYFVYLTTNKINGKQYIGDSYRNNYFGSGLAILNAQKKYGKENFERKILERFPTKEEAFLAQEKYINEYNTLQPNGYNLSPTGGTECGGLHSIETKKKISESNTGKKRTKETRIKNGNYWRGKKFSEEHKKKISNSMTGKPHPHKPHPVSEETKKKISESRKGMKFSEEHKEKLRQAKLGKKRKPFSEETKIKMSEAAKQR